jgi:hypothetical protein
VRAHRYVREGRANDADVAECHLKAAAAGDTHEPAVIGLHTPRRARLAAAPAQGLAGGTPLRCEYCAQRRSRRQGTAGTRSPRRAVLRGASAVRSRRTGAAVRGYSRGYSAVRAHRYVREGRVDDADVAECHLSAAAAGDTHEPAFKAGLHTPRRAKLAAAPAQRVSRRCSTALRVRRTEAVPPVGYCGYSQPTPCGTARHICYTEPPDGSRGVRVLERVLSSARAPICL